MACRVAYPAGCRLAAIVVVACLTGKAAAQECRSYADGDYWLPNPSSASGEYVSDSAAWGDCLLFANTQNVRVIDFSDPASPVQIAVRTGRCLSIAVSGGLAALSGDGYVDLVDLPSLVLRRRITTEPGKVAAAFDGNRLAVAVNRWLGVYDLQATVSIGPTLLAETRLAGEFAANYFSYSWQYESGVSFAHDTIVSWAFGGNNVGGWRGEMIIVSAEPDSALTVIDSVDNIPGSSASTDYYPTRVAATASGFLVSGFLCGAGSYPPQYYSSAVLAGLRLESGNVLWSEPVVQPHGGASMGRGIVADGSRALWSAERMSSTLSASDPYNSPTLYVVTFADDMSSISIDSANSRYPGGRLSYVPTRRVLAFDNHTYRLSGWDQPAADFGSTNGGSRLALLADGSGVDLSWGHSNDPWGGVSFWSICRIDNSGEWPVRSRSFAGDYWYTVEYFAAADSGIYFVQNGEISYVDLRDPAHPGAPVSTGTPSASFGTWRNHLVTVRDSTLTVHTLSADGRAEPIGELHPVPNGTPHAIGGTVYISSTYSYGATVVDMTDPTAPSLATRSVQIRGNLYPQGNVLLAVSDGLLQRADITDPRNPIYMGVQNVGTTIYDAALHGDRLYLALGVRGTGFYRFSLAEGAVPVGGDIQHWSSQLEHVSGRLLITPGPGLLPLDCDDPLPLLVSGFAGAAFPDRVDLAWFSHGTAADGWLRLVRITEAVEVEIARRPLGMGADGFSDPHPAISGRLRYGLDICAAAEPCRRLADITLEPARASASLSLTLTSAPNPLRAGTVVSFDLVREEAVTCEVFDLAGRRVRTLANATLALGRQVLDWDGRDDHGRPVAAGAYIIRAATPRQSASARVVVIR